MKPFKSHKGIVAPLDRANVDTDQIIPKQFLKSIKRTGFETALFFDWRYLADGSPDPGFELNASRFQGASILVTRNNFGCGSSREHAVWAIQQYGFCAIIAPWQQRGEERIPGFADIFKNNCIKNGILPIELPRTEVNEIFLLVKSHEGLEATIDLPAQKIFLGSATYGFEIDAGMKEQLIQGLDEIEKTLTLTDKISAFEVGHNPQLKAFVPAPEDF